jgi:EmrB/QacA subfamily drug resistance transporter
MVTRPPVNSSSDRLDPALLKLMVILLIGATAPFLNATIVNVAINSLGTSFQVSVSTIQWVSTGYLLALAMAMPLSGWAIERFGGKQTWIFSLALFLFGSILAGAAWNISSLIAFRIIQGASAGLMIPGMLTLLIQGAGQKRLGRMITIVSLISVIIPILGPVIGGLFVSNLSWRWIFYINVPICVVGLVLAWRGITATPPHSSHPLDIIGLVLLSPALAAIIYGLSQAGTHGSFNSTNVVIPIVIGVVLLLAFVWHALRKRSEAIIDLHLFRRRSFSISASLLFLSGLALYGAMLLIPLYYQQVRGQSALSAGLILALQGVGTLLTRPVGNFIGRIGPKPIIIVGMALAALGTLAFTQAGISTNELLLGISLVIRGGGLGAASIAMATAAYQGLEHEEVPHATSATRILQQIGGSFGTAVIVVILQQQIANQPAGAIGQAIAYGNTFWWTLGFTMLGFILTLFLPGRKSKRTPVG